ncbi:hypothetical protein D3C76_331070 [compost metagenome]
MRAAGVDVAEGAVDRVVAEDGRGAAVEHQPGHRAGALVGHQRRVVAHLHPLAHFQRYAVVGALHHQLEVAQQQGAAFVGADHRIGQRLLGSRVLAHLAPVIHADPCTVVLDEAVDGALQRADGGRGHRADEDLPERQAEQRRGVHRVARAVLHEAVDGAVRAVFGDEGVFHQNVVGAGGFQAHHVPVVDDRIVAARHQEGAVVRRAAGFLRRHHGAEEGPLAMLAAVGRRDQHAGIVAPHILRGEVVEQRQLPVVDGYHAKYPRRRHAAFGQGHLHFEEVLRLQLVAFPARRLEDAEEPRLVEIADGFLGQLATRGGRWRAFAQYRHQLTGALAQALTDQVLVEHLLFSCDRSPAGACADSSNARAGRASFKRTMSRSYRYTLLACTVLFVGWTTRSLSTAPSRRAWPRLMVEKASPFSTLRSGRRSVLGCIPTRERGNDKTRPTVCSGLTSPLGRCCPPGRGREFIAQHEQPVRPVR